MRVRRGRDGAVTACYGFVTAGGDEGVINSGIIERGYTRRTIPNVLSRKGSICVDVSLSLLIQQNCANRSA